MDITMDLHKKIEIKEAKSEVIFSILWYFLNSPTSRKYFLFTLRFLSIQIPITEGNFEVKYIKYLNVYSFSGASFCLKKLPKYEKDDFKRHIYSFQQLKFVMLSIASQSRDH